MACDRILLTGPTGRATGDICPKLCEAYPASMQRAIGFSDDQGTDCDFAISASGARETALVTGALCHAAGDAPSICLRSTADRSSFLAARLPRLIWTGREPWRLARGQHSPPRLPIRNRAWDSPYLSLSCR